MKTTIPLVISGPTAVGKTALLTDLITKEQFDFEAISADSRQIYKGMTIGTGKDIDQKATFTHQQDLSVGGEIYQLGYYPLENSNIWLLDAAKPSQPFSSSLYQKLATKAIEIISQKKRTPVIIGGTGRYIADLFDSPDTLNVPQNQTLRQSLAVCSVSELQQHLQELNKHKFNQLNQSDNQNPRRLVRAIEIELYKRDHHSETKQKSSKKQYHHITLTAPLHLIKQRIIDRVDKRLKQGMEAEVKQLLETFPHFTTMQSFDTPGYKEIYDYLQNKTDLKTAKSEWISREYNYAKRQLTWLRHQTNSVWFDITKPNWYAKTVTQLIRWKYVSNNTS